MLSQRHRHNKVRGVSLAAVALCFGFFFSFITPPNVEAQQFPAPQDFGTDAELAPIIERAQTGAVTGVARPPSSSQSPSGPSTATAGTPESSATPKGLCDNITFAAINPLSNTPSGTIGACISGIVYVFSVGLAAPFAYVAAILFEFMLAFAINGATYASGVVATGWTVVRDVANMLFIFILIYISFSLILSTDSVDVRKTLARVILAALIINFSFFISRVVVDAGNLLALEFYRNIAAPAVAVGPSLGSVAGGQPLKVFGMEISGVKRVTGGVMQGVNIQSLLGSGNYETWVNGKDWFTVLITMSFIFLSMGAMLAILAYAFLSAAIKLISRVVTLWFTIILSPAAFALWALPQGEDLAKKWWDMHWKNALFPAGFLFVFYLLTIFMQSMGSGGLFGDLFSQFQSANGTWIEKLGLSVASVAIRVAFVVALLLAAVQAGDWFGVYGTEKINSFAKKMTGKGTAGLWGAIGRRTVGVGANALARSDTMRAIAGKGGMVGRTLWRGLDKTSRASFDARAAAPNVLEQVGIGGEAKGKGGYAGIVDKRAKAVEAEAKKLKATDEERERLEPWAQNRVSMSAKIDPETRETVTYAELNRRAEASFTASDGVINAVQANIDRNADELKRAEAGDAEGIVDRATVDRLKTEKTGFAAQKEAAEKQKEAATKTMKEYGKAIENAVDLRDKEIVGRYARSIARPLWVPLAASRGTQRGAYKARKLVKEKTAGEKALENLEKALKNREKEASEEKGEGGDH